MPIEKIYTFDINKVDKIVNILLKDQQILFIYDNKMSPLEQTRAITYCKVHNTFNHHTNSCLCFRGTIQRAIGNAKYI